MEGMTQRLDRSGCIRPMQKNQLHIVFDQSLSVILVGLVGYENLINPKINVQVI